MARKTKEQKAAEAAAKAAEQAAQSDAGQSAPDAAPAAEQPSEDGEAELSLHDALHQLTDDARMRPHWEASIRKFADNHGLGETASAAKWRECLTKYGVKLK